MCVCVCVCVRACVCVCVCVCVYVDSTRQLYTIIRLCIVLYVQWTEPVIQYSHSNDTTKSFSAVTQSFVLKGK